MNGKPLCSLLFVLLLLSSLALAQNQSPPTRDPAALAILNGAVAAMGGGSSLLGQLNSAQCAGSIQAVTGTSAKSGTFVWKHQFSASGYQFRSEFQAQGQSQIFVAGNSGTAVSNNGAVRTLPSQVSMALPPFHLPVVVLSVVLANSSYAVTLGAPTPLRGGVTAKHVTVSLNTDSVSQAVTTEDWYFDPTSGLPLRVEFRLPSPMNALQYTKAAADFANYQSISGILVPSLIGNTEDGVVDSTVTISSVQWNYPVSSSDFTLTGGGQ